MDTLILDGRRRFLVASTTLVGAAGLTMSAIPFLASLKPSALAKAQGALVEVDISKIEPGQQITVTWRKTPVWVLRRTPEILERIDRPEHLEQLLDPNSEVTTQQPDYALNSHRSIRDEYFIVVSICTHLGCVPTFRPEVAPADLGPDWPGGYFCPCHGSRFDFAGRVFKGVPAPKNLLIPPYRFLSDTHIEIGVDHGTAQS
ncbi:MAG: ubiquinol-cytochrome c reductase iron-sulfur subunit [Proteobacteria bacterium]|nr:MAG: ubiquinol-cytochrome c reductase iron-sulfur subunit [Pseudomonadota bacterium]QKK10688.1 MAG: ubiquinol-cytochrome c reductase iron-sulfur subunit [Pseudomonadota bacterium]